MCPQASQLLKKLYVRHMVRKYVEGMTPQRKAQVHSQRVQRSYFPRMKYLN